MSENTPKSISRGPPVTEKRFFKNLKILSSLALFISKTKNAHIFNFLSGKYFKKRLSFLKIWHTWVNIVEITGRKSCYFVSFTTAYRDLMTDKGATAATSLKYLFESYHWKKCLVKVSSSLTYWLENDGPFFEKCLKNWKKNKFYQQFLASLEIIKVIF